MIREDVCSKAQRRSSLASILDEILVGGRLKFRIGRGLWSFIHVGLIPITLLLHILMNEFVLRELEYTCTHVHPGGQMRMGVRMVSGEYSREKMGFTYTEVVDTGTYSVLPSISEQRRINIPFSHQTVYR